MTVLAAAALIVGCGGGDQTDASRLPAATAQPAAEAKPAVPTARVPASPCDWVPVADVETVLGPLAAAPAVANGCRYTLQLPAEVAAKRKQVVEFQQKMARMGATLGGGSGALANWQQDPTTYAVVVSIDPSGSTAAEIGAAAAGERLSEWAGGQAKPADTTTTAASARTTDGWDRRLLVPYGFGGRAGHLTIIVEGQAPDVPDEAARALAALFRDRIPDLPFASQQPQQADGPDPCSLLTREAAEAVLGTLVVPPYRSSAGSSLADSGGTGCSYFTRGHRVLVLTPTWSEGQQEYRTGRVFGALVGTASGGQAKKIEGPWDHAHISTLTGALGVLKGDKMLQVDFLTSSTDQAGAIELARQAVADL